MAASAPEPAAARHFGRASPRTTSAMRPSPGRASIPLRALAFLVYSLSALLLLKPANCFPTSEQFHIVCKDAVANTCVLWPMDSESAAKLSQQFYQLNNFYRCGISDSKLISPHRKFVMVKEFSGSLDIFFCNTIKFLSAEPIIPFGSAIPEVIRTRRQANYRPRGRYRGQTQSQYLSIDRGNGKDEGKAEAHSAADSSRAIVSGNSGMGQAQSQTIYDPSCEDCIGRPDTELASLTHGGKGPVNGQGLHSPDQNNYNREPQIPGTSFHGSNGHGSGPSGLNIPSEDQNINQSPNSQYSTSQHRPPDNNYLINHRGAGGPNGSPQYSTQPLQRGGDSVMTNGNTPNQPNRYGQPDGTITSNQPSPPENIMSPGIFGSNIPRNANNQWSNGVPNGNVNRGQGSGSGAGIPNNIPNGIQQIPNNIYSSHQPGPSNNGGHNGGNGGLPNVNVPNGAQQTPSNIYSSHQTGSPITSGRELPNQNRGQGSGGLPPHFSNGIQQTPNNAYSTHPSGSPIGNVVLNQNGGRGSAGVPSNFPNGIQTPSGNTFTNYPNTGGTNGGPNINNQGNPFNWPILSDLLRQRGAGSTYFCCVVGPDSNIQNLLTSNSNMYRPPSLIGQNNGQGPNVGPSQTSPGSYGGTGTNPTGQYIGPSTTGPYGGTNKAPGGFAGPNPSGQFGASGQGPTGQYGGTGQVPTEPYGGSGQTPTSQYSGTGHTPTSQYGGSGQSPTGQYEGTPPRQYGEAGHFPTGQPGGQTSTGPYAGISQSPPSQYGGTIQGPGVTSQGPTGSYGGQTPSGRFGGGPGDQFSGPGQYGGTAQGPTGQYGGIGQSPTNQIGGTSPTTTGQIGGMGQFPTGGPGQYGETGEGSAGPYGGTGQSVTGPYSGTGQIPTGQIAGTGQTPSGQYGGTGLGPTGQSSTGQYGATSLGPTGQYGGTVQGPTGQYGGTGLSPTGQYGGTGQGPNGQSAGTGHGPTGQYGGTGQGPTSHFGGTGQGPIGQFGETGQYGGTGQGPTGQFGGSGQTPTNQVGGTGQMPTGRFGGTTQSGPYGGQGQTPTGQYGGSGPAGPYGSTGQTSNGPYGGTSQIAKPSGGTGQTSEGPYGGTGQNFNGPYGGTGQTSNGPYGGISQIPPGSFGGSGQSSNGPYGGTGQTPNGPYGGPGQTSSGPYGGSVLTPSGPYGGTGQTSSGPYGGTSQITGQGSPQTGVNNGQGLYNQGNGAINTEFGGEPQNVVDPNSITSSFDDYDSEAEASVAQAVNGTTAVATSRGGNEKGRAQTQVEGTYTGTGSFSANAEISDDNKAAQSHVSGSKKGASSSAEGRGRKNKSQASVKLGSETGSILTDSQSSGDMHSSSSQVQGSVKGGMADAQAKGPGSTSSQAQIGFTPYKEADKEKHDLLKSPFEGGGTASAQSSRRMGTSQSQLRGTFKYGISYNGAAQAGSSLDKDAVFSNLHPFDKIDVFDESNKNINVELETTVKPIDVPLTNTEYVESTTTEKTEIEYNNQNTENEYTQNTENVFSDHLHLDHHKSDSQVNATTRAPPPVGNRRSFTSTYGNNGADYEYPTDKDDPPEEYEIDDGFGTDGNENAPVEQGEYANYDDITRDTETTHQSLQSTNKKPYEIKQTTGGNTQHIILGSLNNHDAKIIQRNSEHPDETRVYQPGEKVPGMGGYTIPAGFTGSVKSVASKDKTYVVGSKYSPSQAQTVKITPGSGKIKYVYPNNYGKNVNPKELRSLYQPKPDDNRYVSVSKSVTRDLDSESNIRKQYSHTYYTKSSSCGYFTFTCTMVSSANGKKKVCKPKIPTNPDGTPMRC